MRDMNALFLIFNAFLVGRDFASGAVISPKVGSWGYMGCASDSVTARTLSVPMSLDDPMTVGGCLTACGDPGYFIAGLEGGTECWCDVQINNSGVEVPDGDCDTPCTGDSTVLCGGTSRLTLYNNTAVAWL